MAAGDIVPVAGAQFEETLASASPDVLREMIREFAQRMMDADVEVRCNAGYGEVTPERVNSRNGYRRREWDTRAGTIELAIPKLRQGSYFPSFLEHRRRCLCRKPHPCCSCRMLVLMKHSTESVARGRLIASKAIRLAITLSYAPSACLILARTEPPGGIAAVPCRRDARQRDRSIP